MDFYHFEDSSDCENLPSLDIEWTLILQFCFLDDLKLHFFTRCLYFHHNWWKERGTKTNSSNILKDVTEEKNVEIYKHSSLSIIWILKLFEIKLSHKLPSKQNYLLEKNFKILFDCLVSLRIWVIQSQLKLLPFFFHWLAS